MDHVQLPGQVGDALDGGDGEAKHGESAQFNSRTRSHKAGKPFGSSGASHVALAGSYSPGLIDAGAPEATGRSCAAFRPADANLRDAFVDILVIARIQERRHSQQPLKSMRERTVRATREKDREDEPPRTSRHPNETRQQQRRQIRQ